MTNNPDNYRPASNGGWTEHAACTGVGYLMYPHPTNKDGIREAKSVCVVCPVRAECLATAMRHGETWGVWGGLTPDERTSLRRRVARNNLRVRNGEDVVPLVLDEVIEIAAEAGLDDLAGMALELDQEEDAA